MLFVRSFYNRDAPDTDFAEYPAKPKAGYRISGRISGASLFYKHLAVKPDKLIL
jgi:hypothetical protein